MADDKQKQVPDGLQSVWIFGDSIRVHYRLAGKEHQLEITLYDLHELGRRKTIETAPLECPTGRCSQ